MLWRKARADIIRVRTEAIQKNSQTCFRHKSHPKTYEQTKKWNWCYEFYFLSGNMNNYVNMQLNMPQSPARLRRCPPSWLHIKGKMYHLQSGQHIHCSIITLFFWRRSHASFWTLSQRLLSLSICLSFQQFGLTWSVFAIRQRARFHTTLDFYFA